MRGPISGGGGDGRCEFAALPLIRVLVDVQRAKLSDPQNNGLAINTVELRNEFDLGSPEGKSAGGVVLFEILYRHASNDPTVQV